MSPAWWLLAIPVGVIVASFGAALGDRRDRRQHEERQRRLALAIEDETDDAFWDIVDRINDGQPMSGPLGDVHQGCVSAWFAGNPAHTCLSCAEILMEETSRG